MELRRLREARLRRLAGLHQRVGPPRRARAGPRHLVQVERRHPAPAAVARRAALRLEAEQLDRIQYMRPAMPGRLRYPDLP